MPECQNCGTVVSNDYRRVMAPDGVEGVRVCPSCPDMIRATDGSVRAARSPRRQSGGEEA